MKAEIDVVIAELETSWNWWLAEADSEVQIKQTEICNSCTSLISKLLEEEHKHNEEETVEIAEFVARFFFDENSLAPWTTQESRSRAREFIKTTLRNETCRKKVEHLLVKKLQHVLLEMNKLGLSNSVNVSGYKHISRMKIRDKLVGGSYTQTLDKMALFKKRYLPYMGYLNVIVECMDIEENWRILLPLLLSFLDDTDFMVKREACNSLNRVCAILMDTRDAGAKSNILYRSQTMPLLYKAVQPLLLALPSLTEESKSVVIVPLAYDTLFKVYRLSIDDDLEYYTRMSALLNDTLLPSIGKCKDHVHVLMKLLHILQQFSMLCGSFSVVLTKPVVYTLLTVLVDPYVAHAPGVVAGCIDVIDQCIQKVPETGRIRYKYDILACVGTLRKRLATSNHNTEELGSKLDALVIMVSQ